MKCCSGLPQACEENCCYEEEHCISSDDTASITTHDSASISELHQSLNEFEQDEEAEDGSVAAPFSVQIQRLEELLDSPENDLASLDRTNTSIHTDEFSFQSEGRDELRDELASAYIAAEPPQQEQGNHHQVEQHDQKPLQQYHRDEHENTDTSSELSFNDEASVASPDECDVSGTWEEGVDCDKKVMKILSRANSLVGGGAEILPIPYQVSFEKPLSGTERKRSKIVKGLIILLLVFLLFCGASLFYGSTKHISHNQMSAKLSSSRVFDVTIDHDNTSIGNEIDDVPSLDTNDAMSSLLKEEDSTLGSATPARTGAERVSRFDVDSEDPDSAVKCNFGDAFVCSTRGGLLRASQATANTAASKDASMIGDEDASCNIGNAFACSTRGGLVRQGFQIPNVRTAVFSRARRFVSQAFRADRNGDHHADEEESLPMGTRVKLMAMASL